MLHHLSYFLIVQLYYEASLASILTKPFVILCTILSVKKLISFHKS